MNELTPEKLLAFFYVSRDWHRLSALGFKIKDAEMKMIKKELKLRQVDSGRQVDQQEVTSMVKSAIEAGLREVKRNFRSGRSREEMASTFTAVSSPFRRICVHPLYVPHDMPTRRILFSQKATHQTDLTHRDLMPIEISKLQPNRNGSFIVLEFMGKDVYKPTSLKF
jgi:hypothetical protein